MCIRDRRDMLLEMFDFVLDQAEIHGEKISGKDRTIEIFMPKISMRDLQRLTQSLRNLGGFINQASRAENMITLDDKDKTRLKRVLHTLLDHIDQSSAIDMLQDVETRNEPEEQDVEALRKMILGEKINEGKLELAYSISSNGESDNDN